ncbi:MAG: alpha-D-ribose 1-methylphosphonate 5-triphosphate diphosphatase [Burkholderiales bacterium]
MKTYVTNARVVLRDQTVDNAAVLFEDGVVVAVSPERADADEVVSLDGGWLLPGLVDLHCDALEKEIEPRPGVLFPVSFAISNADKRNAAAGVTTVYHALSFAHDELGVRNVNTAAAIARSVSTLRSMLLVDNRVHARYEITDPAGIGALEPLVTQREIDMLSFMDHSPGQGQFKTVEAYRDYVVRTYARLPAEAERMAREKIEGRGAARQRMEKLAALAREHDIRIASHDDDTPARVSEMAALGATISEFPVTLEAAVAAREAGLATLFGSPNILRGGSQSGSMRALQAVENDVASALCGDYSPAATLAAVFRLPDVSDLTLAEATQLGSWSAAQAAGLTDRGAIQPGLRADLIAVRRVSGSPQVTHAWCGGRLTYRASYPE